MVLIIKQKYKINLTVKIIKNNCLALLAVLALSCNSDKESLNVQSNILPTLTFDLSTQTEVTNQIGFLHGIDANEPVNDLIEPLKPRYWRAGSLTNEIYDRVTNLGAEYIISISDLYGYPNERVQPYDVPQEYLAFIDNLSTQTLNKPMIYDIWNEPDAIDFWNGTQQQFLETFKLTHDRLRENLGQDILIAGPSVAVFQQDYLIAFCDYAVANNIKLDVLTFHWFRQDQYLPQLKDALDWCYREIIDNPTYESLGIQKVIVGEYINQSQQYDAAYLLAKFHIMEKGRSDGGCHACWPEDDGSLENNCWNQSINGLLDASGQPRATWWAIKNYVEMDAKRAEITSTDDSIFGLSGTINTNTYRLIVGL